MVSLNRRRTPAEFLNDTRRALELRRGNPVVASKPFLDEGAMRTLENALGGCRTFIEYGAGGSTVFASQRVSHVVSVETDARYAAAVRQACTNAGSDAVVQVLTAHIGLTADWGIPLMRRPSNQRLATWLKYVTAPWDVQSERRHGNPVVVLVDGRFRVASAAYSLAQLVDTDTGIVIVDDYAARPNYWVLESIADVVEVAGRAVVLRPRVDGLDRLARAVGDFADDWR